MEGQTMTEREVVDLMASSKSSEEWDANCETVKRKNGGNYPRFWYTAILASGLATFTSMKWKDVK
jgi:hypothetical protein